jgi:hypothetical protein
MARRNQKWKVRLLESTDTHVATNMSNGKIIFPRQLRWSLRLQDMQIAPLEPIWRLLAICLMGIIKRAIGMHLITYIRPFIHLSWTLRCG